MKTHDEILVALAGLKNLESSDAAAVQVWTVVLNEPLVRSVTSRLLHHWLPRPEEAELELMAKLLDRARDGLLAVADDLRLRSFADVAESSATILEARLSQDHGVFIRYVFPIEDGEFRTPKWSRFLIHIQERYFRLFRTGCVVACRYSKSDAQQHRLNLPFADLAREFERPNMTHIQFVKN